MGKYEKLGAYLERQPGGEIPMTFAEIEKIVGGKLPPSSRYPAWWSNNPSNNVMTKIWLRAGFKTEQVSIESRKLVFRRTNTADTPRQREGEPSVTQNHSVLQTQGIADAGRAYKAQDKTSPGAGGYPAQDGYPPFYGSMKGLITIMPGVDLTEPADPEWGKRLERKYGRRGKAP
jgi:hypothetical protein